MNRVIGGGNDNIRAMKLQAMKETATGFDPIGRSRFQHDLVASILDERAADYYSPATEVTRLPDDAGIAQCENNDLIVGQEVVPLPGQNDEVHCMIHIRKLNEFAAQVTGQSANLVQVTPPMRAIADHLDMHIGNLDPSSPNTKEIIQIHEQFLGMIENGRSGEGAAGPAGGCCQRSDGRATNPRAAGQPREG